MRKIFLLFLVSICIVITAGKCKKERGSESLPSETQEGKNTMGCLVNGEVFRPRGGGIGPNYDCYYQLLYPGPAGYVFHISGIMKNGDCELRSLLINVDSLKISSGTYRLEGSVKGKFAGGYDYYQNCNTSVVRYYTTSVSLGEIVIKKFDEVNNIIAGTFWFDATDSSGRKVEVRDGRFDMKYTQ